MHNSARASAFGIAAAEIAAIVDGTYGEYEPMAERERVALLWADAVTANTARAEADLYARVQQLFAPAAIVEMTLLVSYRNMVNRFVDALAVDFEDEAAEREFVAPHTGRISAEAARNLLRRL